MFFGGCADIGGLNAVTAFFYHGLHGFLGLHGWGKELVEAFTVFARRIPGGYPCNPKNPCNPCFKKAGSCVDAVVVRTFPFVSLKSVVNDRWWGAEIDSARAG